MPTCNLITTKQDKIKHWLIQFYPSPYPRSFKQLEAVNFEAVQQIFVLTKFARKSKLKRNCCRQLCQVLVFRCYLCISCLSRSCSTLLSRFPRLLFSVVGGDELLLSLNTKWSVTKFYYYYYYSLTRGKESFIIRKSKS